MIGVYALNLADHKDGGEPAVNRIHLALTEPWAGDLKITCVYTGNEYLLKSVNGELVLEKIKEIQNGTE